MTSVTIYYDGSEYGLVDNSDPSKEWPRFKVFSQAAAAALRLLEPR